MKGNEQFVYKYELFISRLITVNYIFIMDIYPMKFVWLLCST